MTAMTDLPSLLERIEKAMIDCIGKSLSEQSSPGTLMAARRAAAEYATVAASIRAIIKEKERG